MATVKPVLAMEEVDAYRDQTWRRTPELRVETAMDVERLVESLGFMSTLTDARRPGPSAARTGPNPEPSP